MKKTTKSTKLIKSILGLGTLMAFVLPASVVPAYSYNPSIVPAAIQSEGRVEMEGGLNYRHSDEDLKYRHYLQNNVNDTYRNYIDYGRGGNPSEKKDVLNGYTGQNVQGDQYDSEGQTVYVTSVEVSPSEILSKDEINRVVQPLIGQNVGINDVKAAIEQINRLYADKGFVTARAFLPEQSVEGGHIRIELIESKVGNITVENNRWTSANYIKKRINPKEGELFDIVELEKDIMDFNRYNEGVNLSANLKAGEREGTTDVELKANENFPFHLTAMMDNAGRYTTGRLRGGAMITADSLFHQRDKLSIGTYFSGGSVSPFADYNIPVNRRDGRVGFMFSSTLSKVKWGQFSDRGSTPLDLSSRAYTYSLYYTQPLIRKPGFELKGYGSLNYKRAGTWSGWYKDLYDQLPPEYRAGLNSDGRLGDIDNITSIDVALNMRKDTRYGIWYLNQGFGYAIPIFDRDSNYFKIFGGAVRLHDFSHGFIGQLRGNYQVIPNNKHIPYIDQFQAGGMATVRGYPEGSMIGKNGFFTSAELMFPLLPRQITSPRSGEKIPFIGKFVKGAVFADFGGVFPQVNEYQYGGTYFMASLGMGLRVQLPGDLTGRLYWGFPLINSAYFNQDRKVGRFHFELTMEPNFDALLKRRVVETKPAPQLPPPPPKPQVKEIPPEPVNNYDDIRHYDYFNDGGGGSL